MTSRDNEPTLGSDLTPSEREELVELRSEVARIQAYLTAIEPAMIAVAKHVDAAPPPRVEIPPGWLSAKQAAFVAGVCLDTIYRWYRKKLIRGVEHGCLLIDPTSLPVRK
jgi:hypothetical protein